jgi:hypothetical protein
MPAGHVGCLSSARATMPKATRPFGTNICSSGVALHWLDIPNLERCRKRSMTKCSLEPGGTRLTNGGMLYVKRLEEDASKT